MTLCLPNSSMMYWLKPIFFTSAMSCGYIHRFFCCSQLTSSRKKAYPCLHSFKLFLLYSVPKPLRGNQFLSKQHQLHKEINSSNRGTGCHWVQRVPAAIAIAMSETRVLVRTKSNWKSFHKSTKFSGGSGFSYDPVKWICSLLSPQIPGVPWYWKQVSKNLMCYPTWSTDLQNSALHIWYVFWMCLPCQIILKKKKDLKHLLNRTATDLWDFLGWWCRALLDCSMPWLHSRSAEVHLHLETSSFLHPSSSSPGWHLVQIWLLNTRDIVV